MGAAYTPKGVLAKGRAEGSAGEIEELGRELGPAGAREKMGGSWLRDNKLSALRAFSDWFVELVVGTPLRDQGPSPLCLLRR